MVYISRYIEAVEEEDEMAENTTTKIVMEEGHGLYEEKKSRFISQLYTVHSEEEALALVEAAKKRYYDARHTCFAYIIGRDGRTLRAADDGEPQGTAGRPILDVLQGEGLHDAVLIVTRYFGGTLLGTGGLVRAYTRSAMDAVEQAKLAEEFRGVEFHLNYDYGMAGKVEYLFRNRNGVLLAQEYGAGVMIHGLLPEDSQEKFFSDLKNESNGSLEAEEVKPCFYVVSEGHGQIVK
ncbi:MAG TPA: YigZ family protein [Lachnospiraceae bacterium]|nr:YigZ family protein [Lachnospiraceae bacterium]